jgi:paraquat-inducible protein B
MSKGASKTLIGGFVIGGVALLVVALLIFSSGKFFSQKVKLVMFFEESVGGLNLGAPVVFRGVTIGSVVDIELWNYPKETKVLIPIYVELDLDNFKTVGVKPSLENLQRLIQQGLRAQLKTQSLVTGQVMVYMDYFPDKPLKLLGQDLRYPEIPTIPSGAEQIKKSLEELPVEEIVLKTRSALAGIERVINAPETGEMAKNLNATLKDFQQVARDFQRLARNVEAQIDPLAAETKGALGDARTLLKDANKEIIPLAAGLKKALDQAGLVLGETRQALKKASEILSDESVLSAEFLQTLEEINRTMRSVQLLADYLQRHPEALLRGKSPSGGK